MLSSNSSRQKHYAKLVSLCGNGSVTVDDIIQLGHAMMRKARLHHHFFKNSLYKTAESLTFSALQLPLEYEKYSSQTLSEQEARNVIAIFERRIAERMPVEYITNESWYLGNKFYVNENVLVPRSVMNYRFQDFLRETQWQNYRVLDLCTGSGCIGISLALLDPRIKVDLVDVSEKALAVAAININTYSLSERVRCIQSDLFANLTDKYDLIITNPPYVSRSEYKASAAEFKNEPKLALESGKDGLDILHRIIADAKSYLNPAGKLIAEVGYPAAKRLKKHYRHIKFQWLKYKRPEQQSFINEWIDRLFGMDCVFVCDANDLN